MLLNIYEMDGAGAMMDDTNQFSSVCVCVLEAADCVSCSVASV